MTNRRDRQRCNASDDGAALVEFAIVSILLITLIMGIIAFGYLLSFKQNVTQAAAEGARAGAVAVVNTPEEAAEVAVDSAVASFNQSCGGSMECEIEVHDCGADMAIQTSTEPDCITVALDYDYGANPILPSFPVISSLLPEHITASSTAQVNP